MSEKTFKDRISVKEFWLRLVAMVVYAILTYCLFQFIAWIISAFQLVYKLITGKPNKTLQPFADSFSKFLGQIFAYLTYASDEIPFPFNSWPSATAKKPAAKKE